MTITKTKVSRTATKRNRQNTTTTKRASAAKTAAGSKRPLTASRKRQPLIKLKRQLHLKYKIALAALLVVTLGASGMYMHQVSAATTTKTELQYFVSPHPDDVYSAWGMVQHSTSNYPVFVVLTAGEATTDCKGQTMTIAGYGTYTKMVPNSASCKNARMNSLNAWLDNQAAVDPTLDNLQGKASKQYCFKPQSSTVPYNTNNKAQYACASYYIGANSARVEFDLGDGNLTTAEVNWAIKNVRSNRSVFPVTQEYGVVADAFYNRTYASCGVYTHPDHIAVQTAIYHTDQFPDFPTGSHPQFGVTCPTDPDYKTSKYMKTVTASDYSANMACPGGYFQTRFSWLAFGGSKPGCWAYGTQSQIKSSTGANFASDEYFWIKNHPKS